MSPEELIERFPRLFHMAEADTWPSIQRRGLLSTSALLDHFEIHGPDRHAIEACHRPECVPITHPEHGTAIIRDQKPMSDKALEKCLLDMKPSEWYKFLNRRVFFWVSWDRLVTLLQARAYRERKHCVLTVDTKGLVDSYYDKITLSPINSGCTVPNPQPRGSSTFLSINEYPLGAWIKKRGNNNPIVELAVDYSVPDIARYVIEVTHMRGNRASERLWLRQK